MKVEVSPEPVVLLDDEAGRRYQVGEGLTQRELPSLSEIMRRVGYCGDYSKVPLDRLVRAQQLGTCVHKMLEINLTGGMFRPDGMDPLALAMFESGRKLFYEKGWKALYVERPTVDFEGVFGCTADLVFEKPDGGWGIIDWKTGVKVTAWNAVQVNLQERHYRREDGECPELLIGHLQRDGSMAKLIPAGASVFEEAANAAFNAEKYRKVGDAKVA